MRKFWTVLILALIVAMVPVSASAADEGTVTVIHGVPGLTVDVYVNNDLTIEDFAPDTITDPLKLPAGDYKIDIRPAGAEATSAPAITGSTTLPAGANASIIAHLGENGSPTLSVFVNDTSRLAAGKARLTVRHTAAAPAVDILAGGNKLFTNLANAKEAKADVDAASYSVAVAATGTTQPVIGPADLKLDAGTSYLVYAVGSLNDNNLHLLVQTIPGLGGTPTGAGAGVSGIASSSALSSVAVALGALLVVGALGSGLVLARQRR